MHRCRTRPIPPKGRELVRRALACGRARPKGAGEASSLRAMIRRAMLDAKGEPTDRARTWATCGGLGVQAELGGLR